MRRGIIALTVISVLALVLNGCATTGSGSASPGGKKSRTVTISTGEFHEFCDMWDVGDTVEFSFTSSKPVEFNVHYHTADHKKHYPINNMVVDTFSGSFVVQTGDVHCGSWENKNDRYVRLTYEMEAVTQ